MELLYPFFIAFLLVFISELGDKTQLLVLSFSNKIKPAFILLGVALGSFFSHGIAILFGSSVSLFENDFIHSILEFITYLSFILLGVFSFFNKNDNTENSKKESYLKKLSTFGVGYVFIIAFSSVIFIESIIKLTISIYNLITFPKKIIIATDTLCNINNKRIYNFFQIDFRYCLRFSKNGDFVLDEKLELSSLNINDTFYLAMINEKIIKIYNNKFFILEE